MRTQALRVALTLVLLTALTSCAVPPPAQQGGVWNQSRWNEATWQ
jgi:hypothetical protein